MSHASQLFCVVPQVLNTVFPSIESLREFLKRINHGDDICQRQSEDFISFCETLLVCLPEDMLYYTFPSPCPVLSPVTSKTIHQTIEQIITSSLFDSGNGNNFECVLSEGFRLNKNTMVLECDMPNPIHGKFFTQNWMILFSFLGPQLMESLLSRCCLMEPLPNRNYLQLCGPRFKCLLDSHSSSSSSVFQESSIEETASISPGKAVLGSTIKTQLYLEEPPKKTQRISESRSKKNCFSSPVVSFPSSLMTGNWKDSKRAARRLVSDIFWLHKNDGKNVLSHLYH